MDISSEVMVRDLMITHLKFPSGTPEAGILFVLLCFYFVIPVDAGIQGNFWLLIPGALGYSQR